MNGVVSEGSSSNEVFRRDNRRKLMYLTLSFFFLIAGYTLVKELKDAIFVAIVGTDYLPWAKNATLFILIPLIFFYSILVDRLRRYQLLTVFSVIFSVLGLIFAYFLGHPTIGISNTDTSPYRLFGWIVYLAFEAYSPFVVGVFWAFANSISTPSDAKKDYATIIAGSKVGGALTALLGWFVLSWRNGCGAHVLPDVPLIQLTLVLASLLLLCVPLTISFLIKRVPGYLLHGYEAVYQAEKEKSKKSEEKPGIFSGLIMLIRYPYVLGVFGMLFFFEVINVVLNFQRISVAQAASSGLADFCGNLFMPLFFMHVVGFFIAFFGTRSLFQWLGERRCLLLIPGSAGFLVFVFMMHTWFGNPFMTVNTALMVLFVLLRSINYAFSYPLREALYIPTVKDVKFKSKSWIDAYGSKLAKSFGSFFNIIAKSVSNPGTAVFLLVYSLFFGGIIGLWYAVAFLLGKRYEWAVKHNEVIGLEK